MMYEYYIFLGMGGSYFTFSLGCFSGACWDMYGYGWGLF
jgi:hypothetical protein